MEIKLLGGENKRRNLFYFLFNKTVFNEETTFVYFVIVLICTLSGWSFRASFLNAFLISLLSAFFGIPEDVKTN